MELGRVVVACATCVACGRIDFAPIGTPLPSCMGLAPTCGPGLDQSCCESPLVPGGTFLRSFDRAPDGNFSDPSAPATVSPFRLDRYEATVGRFREFVEAGAGTQEQPPDPGSGAHAAIAGSGWDPGWNAMLAATPLDLRVSLVQAACAQVPVWTDAPADSENRPINCLGWAEAFAFCIWDGGYLPTEAEWNFAASGGDQQRVYPWSVPPEATQLDETDGSFASGADDCGDDGVPGCAVDDLSRVGTRVAGDGRWGQADLAGNVQEWQLDAYEPYVTPCVGCANLTDGDPRGLRGSSFFYGGTQARSAARGASLPFQASIDSGVRCARAP